MNATSLFSCPLWAIVAMGFGLAPQTAQAEFAVCNQSFDVANVAIGQFDGDVIVTEGWWTIGPNQCANVIRNALQKRFIYVFAQDVFGNEIVSGVTRLCIEPTRFEIRTDTNCLGRGYLDANFLEVDTLQTERWTLFLTPPP